METKPSRMVCTFKSKQAVFATPPGLWEYPQTAFGKSVIKVSPLQSSITTVSAQILPMFAILRLCC
jgi:hypothetical protein